MQTGNRRLKILSARGLIAALLAVLLGPITQAAANNTESGGGDGVRPTADAWFVWSKKQAANEKRATRPRLRAGSQRRTARRKAQQAAARRLRAQAGGSGLRSNQRPQRRTAVARAGAQPAASTLYASNQVIAAFPSATTDQEIDAFALEFGLNRVSDTQVQLLGQQIVLLSAPADLSDEAVLQLAADPRTVSAQRNFIYRLSADASLQYAVDRLQLASAQRLAQGTGIRVAVIDSGIDSGHPSLIGAVAASYDATLGGGQHDTRHGTALASVIAARQGIVGTAPGVDLLSVTAFSREGNSSATEGTTYTLARGIDWSVTNSARLLNLSFAGPRDPLLHEMLIASTAKGVIAIAAVGNDGPDAPAAFPAAYPEVIAATATDVDDRLYRKAVLGEHVSVAAPGVDILVAAGKNGYGLSSGTSLAAAYVTGVAALLLQSQPNLRPREMEARLGASARDLGPSGRDREFGYGLIDAARLLRAQ